MIKETHIKKINNYLQSISNSCIEVNSFKRGMANIFGVIINSDNIKNIELQFSYCTYIQGPTIIESAKLTCQKIIYDGVECFEVSDSTANFKVIFTSAIRTSDGKFYVSI